MRLEVSEEPCDQALACHAELSGGFAVAAAGPGADGVLCWVLVPRPGTAAIESRPVETGEPGIAAAVGVFATEVGTEVVCEGTGEQVDSLVLLAARESAADWGSCIQREGEAIGHADAEGHWA